MQNKEVIVPDGYRILTKIYQSNKVELMAIVNRNRNIIVPDGCRISRQISV